MLNEKQMISLGGKFLAQYEEAEFVTVFPDENVFLAKADNHAKVHARDSKLEGLKVTREMIPAEPKSTMTVTKIETSSEKKHVKTDTGTGTTTTTKAGKAGNGKKSEEKAPVSSGKGANVKSKKSGEKAPLTSSTGESPKADVDNTAEKAPAAAVEGEGQTTETKVDATTNEGSK